MFELAWAARGGLVLNLKEVPDHILDDMLEWTEEKLEAGDTRL